MLSTFLDAKPLYYDKIDYSRMPRVYASIKKRLPLAKIIHLVGTNGKGTTGRFLATALFCEGYRVGHYTSPHISLFNERIWLNGELSSNDLLEDGHRGLLKLLSPEDANSLSYFEYTTLLAIYLYKDMDYVILEAGLGGEYDATAVFENILTIVTPIDKDHEAFLGDTIEKIAQTKLNAIQKIAIFSKQKHQEVYTIADNLAEDRNLSLHNYEDILESEDREKIDIIAKEQELPKYLQENLSVAVSALKFLNIPYRVESFEGSRLYGRLTRISQNIIVDVGHNVLAASAIVDALSGEKFTLVYNSYRDKNYKEILSLLRPIVSDVALISIDEERIEDATLMEETLDVLEISWENFDTVVRSKNYLVFGSFSVVEAFLKVYDE